MHRPLCWFLDALQPGVLFVRLLCRGGNTPHGQISDRVAAHSPWPDSHQLRNAWAGLLVEGVLIHLIMAITAVPLLLIIFCHHATRVALVPCCCFYHAGHGGSAAVKAIACPLPLPSICGQSDGDGWVGIGVEQISRYVPRLDCRLQ